MPRGDHQSGGVAAAREAHGHRDGRSSCLWGQICVSDCKVSLKVTSQCTACDLDFPLAATKIQTLQVVALLGLQINVRTSTRFMPLGGSQALIAG